MVISPGGSGFESRGLKRCRAIAANIAEDKVMKGELQWLLVRLARRDFENRSVRDQVVDHDRRSLRRLKVLIRAPGRYQNAHAFRTNTPDVAL